MGIKETILDIKFDQSKYDITLSDSGEGMLDLDFITATPDKLMQRLFLRLKAYPRDLFWNTSYGIDYLNSIFGRNRPKQSVDVILMGEIDKEPLVKEITYFESEVENYTYGCKFSVKAIDDDTVSTFYLLTNENGLTLTDSNGDKLTSRI